MNPYKKPIKFQSQGFSSAYGPNTLPMGLNPSTSIAYAEGASELLEGQQQQLANATDLYSQSISTPFAERLLTEGPLPQMNQQSALSGQMFQGLNKYSYDKVSQLLKPNATTNLSQFGLNPEATFQAGADATSFLQNYKPDLSSLRLPGGTGGTSSLASGTTNTLSSGAGYVPAAGPTGFSQALTTEPFRVGAESVANPNMLGQVNITAPGAPPTLSPKILTEIPTGGTPGLPPQPNAPVAPGGAAGGASAGVNLGQTAGIGMAASLVGTGIKAVSDDNDPRTLNFGETTGQLIQSGGTGASLAALAGTLAPALAIPGIGWIGAGIGALVGIGSALFRRRKARREAKKQENEWRDKARKHLKSARRSEAGLVNTNLLSRTYSGYDYGKPLVQYKMGGALKYYDKGGNLAGLAQTLLPQNSQNNTNDLADLILGKQGKLPYSGSIQDASLKKGGTVPQYQSTGFMEGEWDFLNPGQNVSSGPVDTTKVNTGLDPKILDMIKRNDITGTNSLEELKKLLEKGKTNLDTSLSKGIPNLEDIQKLMQLDKILKKPNFKDRVIMNKKGGTLKYQDEGTMAQPDTLWNQNFTSFMNDKPEYHYLTTDETGRNVEGIGTNYNQSGTLVNRPLNSFKSPYFPGNVGIMAPGGLSTNWGPDLRNQVTQNNANYYANQLFNSKNE